MIPLLDRLTLHTAIQERSLDPLVGYNLEYYVQQVDGLGDTSFERYYVPVSPNSDGESCPVLRLAMRARAAEALTTATV